MGDVIRDDEGNGSVIVFGPSRRRGMDRSRRQREDVGESLEGRGIPTIVTAQHATVVVIKRKIIVFDGVSRSKKLDILPL